MLNKIMRYKKIEPYNKISTAFLIFCLCGSCSLLLDVDHVLSLLWQGIPITLENLNTKASRPLHIPIMFMCLGICIYRFTRLYRLRTKMVLKHD